MPTAWACRRIILRRRCGHCRLRETPPSVQAQSTLDQIAAAARLINPSAGVPGGVPPAGRPAQPETQPVAAAHTHTVMEGDSLSRISLRYYGTPNLWQEIYDANREELAGANMLRPG